MHFPELRVLGIINKIRPLLLVEHVEVRGPPAQVGVGDAVDMGRLAAGVEAQAVEDVRQRRLHHDGGLTTPFRRDLALYHQIPREALKLIQQYGKIRLSELEKALGKKKSQIEEYLEFYKGPGGSGKTSRSG